LAGNVLQQLRVERHFFDGQFGGSIYLFFGRFGYYLKYHTRYGIDLKGLMSHTINDKEKLILRAKRIQGQVEALVRTLSEERDCSEVLQVMSAARGAMNSLMAELLEGHIRSHVLNGKQKPTSQQVTAADEVIDMVKSYLK
jgi:DNA-binding FrmR family transcriptional regulator